MRCFQPLSHLSVQADQLLKLAKDSKPRPGVVHYEHQHLSPEDRDAAEALLHSHGYTLHRSQFDTLAVLDQATRDVPRRMKPLRTLALSLEAEGRADDALLLLDHLAAVQPGDAETLRPLVKLLSAKGRTLEAIRRLSELKAVTADMNAVLANIQNQMPAAIERFNERLAAGDVEEAEKYASALVADLARLQPERIRVVHPGDHRVLQALRAVCGERLEVLEDRHFLPGHDLLRALRLQRLRLEGRFRRSQLERGGQVQRPIHRLEATLAGKLQRAIDLQFQCRFPPYLRGAAQLIRQDRLAGVQGRPQARHVRHGERPPQ